MLSGMKMNEMGYTWDTVVIYREWGLGFFEIGSAKTTDKQKLGWNEEINLVTDGEKQPRWRKQCVQRPWGRSECGVFGKQ